MKAVYGLLLLGLFTLLAELPPLMGQADICRLPKQDGNCKTLSLRWFYNRRSDTCERFVYGGCGGNANNFKTPRECLDICTPSGLRRFHHRPDEDDIPGFFHDAADIVDLRLNEPRPKYDGPSQ
uniref:BPTI/Kunitz inhibitor domain-containing protein n=1 Tax=Micrurus carvalhoi TaxID=3147026 RepID=A0A2H6MU77_9SAUR